MAIMCIPNRRQKVRKQGAEMTTTLWKSAFRCLLQLSQWSDVAASIRCGKNLLFTESILAKLVRSLSFCMAWYHAYMNANFDKFWRDLRFWSSSTTFLLDFLGSSLVILEAKIISSGSCGLKTIWASQCTKKKAPHGYEKPATVAKANTTRQYNSSNRFKYTSSNTSRAPTSCCCLAIDSSTWSASFLLMLARRLTGAGWLVAVEAELLSSALKSPPARNNCSVMANG